MLFFINVYLSVLFNLFIFHPHMIVEWPRIDKGSENISVGSKFIYVSSDKVRSVL